MWVPGDLIVDPSKLTKALSIKAQEQGSQSGSKLSNSLGFINLSYLLYIIYILYMSANVWYLYFW